MTIALYAAAVLHLAFMLAEMFPWKFPFLLRKAANTKPLPEDFKDAQQQPQAFTIDQLELVSGIVHNAGIYNGIVAGGLFWAAIRDPHPLEVARVLLCGAVAAGLFGAITLKNPVPAIQAAVGLAGLILVWG